MVARPKPYRPTITLPGDYETLLTVAASVRRSKIQDFIKRAIDAALVLDAEVGPLARQFMSAEGFAEAYARQLGGTPEVARAQRGAEPMNGGSSAPQEGTRDE